MKTLMLLLKLVYLCLNKHLVPLLQGLESESNMFMASSCLAPPGHGAHRKENMFYCQCIWTLICILS